MKNGLLYTLITAILFVTLEPVSKLIANDVSPYAITFWRFLLGAIILMIPALMKAKKEKLRPTAKEWSIATLLGILFICISMLSLQLGVKKSDSPALIAIIFSANSIFTILFALLLLKEKLTKNKLFTLIFGAIGVLLCTDFSSGTNLTSAALGIFAALTFSLYTVLTKKYFSRLGGMIQSAMVFLSGSIVLFIFLLCSGADWIPTFSAANIGILLYLGIFVTGIGYACYFLAMEKGGTIMASLAFFIKPILTPFVTWMINDIVPDWKIFVAVACIVIASCFTMYKKKEVK